MEYYVALWAKYGFRILKEIQYWKVNWFGWLQYCLFTMYLHIFQDSRFSIQDVQYFYFVSIYATNYFRCIAVVCNLVALIDIKILVILNTES